MKRATAWITAALVLTAGTGASAQNITEQAEDKLRSAMMTSALEAERQQRTHPTRGRSLTRTWSGIALAAAGAATALMGRSCRTMGSLPRDSVQPFHDATITTSMTDLYAYSDDGDCRINFQIHVSVTEHVPDPKGSMDHHESYLYNDLNRYSRQGLPDNLAGTARATQSLDQRRLYTGIAMAATGIALATIFADIPLGVTEMSQSRITVGSELSW